MHKFTSVAITSWRNFGIEIVSQILEPYLRRSWHISPAPGDITSGLSYLKRGNRRGTTTTLILPTIVIPDSSRKPRRNPLFRHQKYAYNSLIIIWTPSISNIVWKPVISPSRVSLRLLYCLIIYHYLNASHIQYCYLNWKRVILP